jgi:ABC-2 type transport system permease protein
MNAATETRIEPAAGAPVNTIADYPKTRLLYWSIRRELWENRSIYLGPLIVAVVMLVGFVLGARRLKDAIRAIYMLDPARQAEMLTKPLSVTAVPIVAAASLVALFYCLDALHGERRDRSILFWKSLPVSDFVTVLSKVLVPLVVLPAVTCLTIIGLQFLVVLLGSVILLTGGLDGAALWSGLPLLKLWITLIYGIVALALWYAPIYLWLLLVSGWAKRSTFLWAVLPPLALCLIERIAFDTTVLWKLLLDRLDGFMPHGFVFEGRGNAVPDPLALFATPGLWIGLAVALGLFAATVWFRRYRQPI